MNEHVKESKSKCRVALLPSITKRFCSTKNDARMRFIVEPFSPLNKFIQIPEIAARDH